MVDGKLCNAQMKLKLPLLNQKGLESSNQWTNEIETAFH